MTYASISIDRRPEYAERLSEHMKPLRGKAADLAWAEHNARAESGRKVQSGIQRHDLTLDRLRTMGRKLRLVAGVAMARGR